MKYLLITDDPKHTGKSFDSYEEAMKCINTIKDGYTKEIIPFVPPYTKPEPSQSVKPESLTNHSQSLASDLNIDLNAEPDMVNHPPHYANKDPETIQMIRAVLTKEEFIGYCKGQILKYRDRAHDKGNLEQDMAKAKFYYDLLEEVRNESILRGC